MSWREGDLLTVDSIHVVPNIDVEASGPSYSVTRLCEALSDCGYSARLAVLNSLPSGTSHAFVKAFEYGAGPRRLGVSPQMKRWLQQQARSGVGIIHSHSLWMMPNVYPASAVRGTATKLVISPRGTLSQQALSRSAWVKKVFWHALQGPAIATASAFHATSQQEYQDIRNKGLNQPVAIIPNGVDVPELHRNVPVQPRRLLFLGRIHPIEGLSNLLTAWQSLHDAHPDWELVVAGPDNGGHRDELSRQVHELDLQRCSFAGPVYGADKLQAYRDADLYVLPTLSENFGMTVAEALAAGTPVITTRNAPWQGLESHDAGWWADGGAEPLAAALGTAMQLPRQELVQKGLNGRNWMVRDFSWTAIAQDMASFYEWVVRGGETPEFVQLK